MAAIDPVTAVAVLLATAATDAVYVMFTSAVVTRKRVPAATWSSIWYLLSSYAVIHYTENGFYVAFAAIGSWIGAYTSITFLHRPPGGLRWVQRRNESWIEFRSNENPASAAGSAHCGGGGFSGPDFPDAGEDRHAAVRSALGLREREVFG
jgi:hypothetical protein